MADLAVNKSIAVGQNELYVNLLVNIDIPLQIDPIISRQVSSIGGSRICNDWLKPNSIFSDFCAEF